MARKPPRITSRRRQPTTRGGPRVTSRAPQPTTGRGRLVRGPSLARVFGPSWGRPPATPKPTAPSVGGVPASQVAPPAYSLTNLPVDASYDASVLALQRQRDQQLAALVGERSRTLSDYGFQEGPTGTLTFDPNNAFSKAAVMKKTFDTNRRSTGNSMAAGGQLYGGAYQNAQDLINRNQLQSSDALQKNLMAFLARNTSQRAEAGTAFESAVGQALGDRISRFQSNPNYDPASGALSDGGATAGTTSSTPPSNAAPPSGGGGGGGARKVARGYVWVQNSNGTWRRVRPVNAFGH